MNDFHLLKEIKNPVQIKKTGDFHKITYQNYSLKIDKEYSINIPIRECEKFEKEIDETDLDLMTQIDFKKLIRKYRGIID